MYNTGELVSLWSMVLASGMKDPEFRCQTRPWASLVAQDSKEPACNVGDLGSIPGLGRGPGGGLGNILQYSCLENPNGQRCMEGYSPWGCKELDMTKQLTLPLLRPIKYHFIKYHYNSQLKEKKLRIRRVMWLFNGWVIFHGVYVPQLPYPFVCW